MKTSVTLALLLIFLPSLCFAGSYENMYGLQKTVTDFRQLSTENNIIRRRSGEGVGLRADDPRLDSGHLANVANRPLNLTKYGYDLYRANDQGEDTDFSIRSGVSRMSTKGAASLELIWRW